MKTIRFALLVAVCLPTVAFAQVGVSVSVGQPGFYGRLDVGGYPRPQLIYAEPVIIERVAVRPAPIYVHVPPGQEKKWHQYCHHYGACGRPVYFVRDSWYNTTYVPTYREKHGHGHGGPSRGPDKDRGRDWDDHGHDHDHGHDDHDRGNGRGNGRGHDRD